MLSPKRAIFAALPVGQAHAARAQTPICSWTSASRQWPDHHLALQPQPGGDEPELPVAVGGLVQVHEVHVDVGPGDLAVELRVQVQERLLQRLRPAIHILAGRERVHPGDQADAGSGRIGLQAQRAGCLRAVSTGLKTTRTGIARRSVEGRRDRARVLGDRLQRLRAIEVLAAGDEPDFGLPQGSARAISLECGSALRLPVDVGVAVVQFATTSSGITSGVPELEGHPDRRGDILDHHGGLDRRLRPSGRS